MSWFCTNQKDSQWVTIFAKFYNLVFFKCIKYVIFPWFCTFLVVTYVVVAINLKKTYRSTPNLIGYWPGSSSIWTEIFYFKKTIFIQECFGQNCHEIIKIVVLNHLRMYNLVELCTEYFSKVLNKQKLWDRSTYRLR